jgi:hypothetical protein
LVGDDDPVVLDRHGYVGRKVGVLGRIEGVVDQLLDHHERP